MTLTSGEIVDGKYTISRLIGAGGMGNVYEAENVLIHRRVAIKVLNADVADDEQFARRFEREAQAAGRIGSDHIVEVLDLGSLPSGERYMVMEYLQGESLRARMDRQRRMPPEALVPILLGLLDGLEDAHAAGIIHRDLKPDNIFLTDDRAQADFVKILDFGISKFTTLGGDDVTATGMMLGTPRYMAPEQAKGDKDIDFRADIFSVGVVLFRALAGRPPFVADTYNELMFKLVLEDPPLLADVVEDADLALSRIANQAMSRDRERRHASARELADELRTWMLDRGHTLPSRSSTRRQRQSSSGPSSSGPSSSELSTSALSASGFDAAILADATPTRIESSTGGPIAPESGDPSTRHATTLDQDAPTRSRRWWPTLAVAAALVVVAITAYRLGSADRNGETPEEPTVAASEPDPVESPTESEPAASNEAPTEPEPVATAAPSASAPVSASTSEADTPPIAAPPAPPTGVKPPQPVTPQPTGPKRKYRRTL